MTIMYITKIQINFHTHSCYITVDEDGRISVFKTSATNSYCDFESFTNQLDASEYILEPLSSIQYYVAFSGDDAQL
jgi:hypothetical protein